MDSNTTTYTKAFSIDLERASYHSKCRKKRTKRLLLVLFVWAIIIIYFISPLSRVNLRIEGNVYYSKRDVLSMTYINKSDYWWLVDSKKAEKVLESYKYISNVDIRKSFLGLKMKFEEIYPIAIRNDKYLLSNGHMIEKEEYELNDRIHTLADFNLINQMDLEYLINKYSKIDLNVRNHFNKVEIVKDSNDYNYVKLFGNDEKIGSFIIKTDLVFLDIKFNDDKYRKIIEEVSKKAVIYSDDAPCLIAYHYLNEEEFHLVNTFEEE